MKTTAAVAGLIVVISWTLTWGQEQVPEQPAPAVAAERAFHVWMDIKLKESQNILAALADGDFPAIVKSADGLQAISKLEAFVRRRTPGYRTQARAFEFAVQEIRTQAADQNLEGVALGFHQMTLSCVNCHKQMRNRRDEEETPPRPANSKARQP